MNDTVDDSQTQEFWDHFEGHPGDPLVVVPPGAKRKAKKTGATIRRESDERTLINSEETPNDVELQVIAQGLADSGVYADPAGELVGVYKDQLRTLGKHAISVRIATRFVFASQKPGERPPLRVSEELMSHPELFPSIAGVTPCPVVHLTGSVVSAGYDKHTELFVSPAHSYTQELPSTAAGCAAELLELVGDFPFLSNADRGAWLAMIASAVLRPVIRGACPGFVITATTRGTGKTLLAEAAMCILQGTGTGIGSEPPSIEEARKVVLSQAMRGIRFMVWDNLQNGQPFGNALVDSLLTSQVYSDRILGGNTVATVRIPFVLVCTGNNVKFAADTSRRIIVCKLQTPLERPEDRQDYQIKDLRAHIEQHRPRLLALAIRMCALGLADRSVRTRIAGSFEQWSATVARVVASAGYDVHECFASRDPEADETENYRSVLLGYIATKFPKGCTTLQLLKLAMRPDMEATEADAEAKEAFLALSESRVRSSNDTLHAGRALRAFTDSTVRGRRLVCGAANGSRTWRVTE